MLHDVEAVFVKTQRERIHENARRERERAGRCEKRVPECDDDDVGGDLWCSVVCPSECRLRNKSQVSMPKSCADAERLDDAGVFNIGRPGGREAEYTVGDAVS